MKPATSYSVVARDRDLLLRADGIDAWDALTLTAALSADPRSFDELRRAYLRYRPEQSLNEWPWQGALGVCPEGCWMVVDLADLRLTVGGGGELPESPAAYEPDEPHESGAETPLVWVHLPPQWRSCGEGDWHRALPPLSVPHAPLDARGVLFGRALAEGIAERAVALARHGKLPDELPPDEALDGPLPDEPQLRQIKQWQSLTVRVHASWLMTPRDDLHGEPPRTFLHRDREWVDRELHYRQMQWSRQRRAPRPIDRDTFAYRFGPLGSHEVVMYFGLCRAMIAHAWRCLAPNPAIDVATLAESLHQHAAHWLAHRTEDQEDPMPPAHVIEHERRRMPLVASDSPLDCDCPLCRMQAEHSFGPSFYGYDGYHLELDNEFAFSLCADRQQWQREQDEFRHLSEWFAAECEASERDVVARDCGQAESPDEVPTDGVWQRTMINWDAIGSPGVPAEMAIIGIGMLVGELVEDLNEAGVERSAVNRLNVAFDDYRCAAGDAARSEAAQSRLADRVESLTADYPWLTAKAADLQSRLADLRLVARAY